MDVQCGCLNASMPRERRDFMDAPVCPGNIGKTQVPEGVRGELRQATTLGYPCDSFRPGPYRYWSAAIPIGFRQEQRPTLSAEFSALAEILSEEHPTRFGIWDDPFPPILRNLQSNAEKPMRGVDVSGFQGTDFFASKSSVVRQCQHRTIS